MDHLIVAGMVTRAQSLHVAALGAIDVGNPHAAFTLLRAYIEQCAAALYLTDHPDKAERLWNDLEGHGVPIGRITSYADRSGRFKHFSRVYDQLSKYAHPSSISHFAGMRMAEGNHFTFQTTPRFKRDEEKLVAYAWLIEFAYITGEQQAHRGNRSLRGALYISAFASLRHPASRAYYDRKKAEGKTHTAALTCLGRRRVDVLYAMLRDRQTYRADHLDPSPPPTADSTLAA